MDPRRRRWGLEATSIAMVQTEFDAIRTADLSPCAHPPKARPTMKVHEYQAKDLLRAAGVAVPDGILVTTPDEAAAAFTK